MRKLMLISLLSLFALTSYAQADVNFGARAGVNLATLSGDDSDFYDTRTAIYLGFMAEFGLTDMLALRPELNFSMQGAKISEGGEEADLKINYLNIPVMLKIGVTDGFYFEAGPQIGFLMSADVDFDGVEVDIKDEVKDIDFGGNIGLGYELENGLLFNARYNIGFTDLNEDDTEGSNQNSVISIGIGYMF
ncbi:porin family protein [Lentiprolixibacter aurantiacus]|uniref:Porin family protein n=1 Tax=Lentiprolixibacter aurantiacus TaxID=2993939 RepID=A0AAE3MM76_9FLAO|nr:porin family protein [Lentiprolixibacter aurantiacus]MCX2719983.1 porin family protein [Lentiprolixibacter aurantiacus]